MTDTLPGRLLATGIVAGYAGRQVLKQVDALIPDGKITAMIGANGSGKSTLLRTLARIIQPVQGTVLLDGKSIFSLPGKTVARTLALLPQNPLSPDGLTVRQLCHFGRHPHKTLLARLTADDENIIDEALSATGLSDLAERNLDELSGGQRQRAWIAMALAQETPLLLLDEPTTYLDIAHQIEVLELLRKLNRTRNRTIVMVVHDLNQAAQFADHVIALVNGAVHATGAPADLLCPDLIRAVFGIESLVIEHPIDGTPLCLPLPEKSH